MKVVKGHFPDELPMRSASEAEYALVANVMGASPDASELVMSNGVRVGIRRSGGFVLSPDALEVAKRWTGSKQGDDGAYEVLEAIAIEGPIPSAQKEETLRVSRTNYILIDLENVQPNAFSLLRDYDCLCYVPCG